MAEPEELAPQEPPEPAAGTSLVSPSAMVMRSIGTPSISAAI